jgi:hypothetical protein
LRLGLVNVSQHRAACRIDQVHVILGDEPHGSARLRATAGIDAAADLLAFDR